MGTDMERFMKTTYLPPAGPRRGQSVDEYLFGKDIGHKGAMERYRAIQEGQRRKTGKRSAR